MKNKLLRGLAALLMAAALTLSACQKEEPPPISGESTSAPTGSDAVSDAGTENPEKEQNMERYFIYRIWNFTKNSLPDFQKTVDAAAETGFNAIKVHIPWSWVEQSAGQYDYADFDAMLDYVIREKGLKAAVSLDLTRLQNDTVLDESCFMRSRDGALCVGGIGGNRVEISFSSEKAMNAAVAFYTDAVTHYNALYGNSVLFYLPAFSQYCETEYWCTDDYDYSDAALEAFRAYAAQKYSSVEEFNTIMRQSCASFADIQAPEVRNTQNISIFWYQFRHNQLKNAIDALSDAQHAAAPGTKFAVQFGCVFDPASTLRGTLGFADLCEKVDVLWADDAPAFNHAFSMDYLRSNLPETIELAQEIDGPTQQDASKEHYLDQGLTSFAHGCKYLSIANWWIGDEYRDYEEIWKEIAGTWLTPSHPDMVPLPETKPELELSLSELFATKDPTKIISRYARNAKDGGAVRITVTDDLTHAVLEKAVYAYSFPEDFSDTQGEGNWYYMSYVDGDFVEMTFNDGNGRWQGGAPFTLIMEGSMHPDEVQPALVFRSTESGTASVAFDFAVDSSDSNGVGMTVLKNGERLYPADAERVVITADEGVSETLRVELAEGDTLAFVLDTNGSSSYDTTAVTVKIVIE